MMVRNATQDTLASLSVGSLQYALDLSRAGDLVEGELCYFDSDVVKVETEVTNGRGASGAVDSHSGYEELVR